jgi:hypothetical protein
MTRCIKEGNGIGKHIQILDQLKKKKRLMFRTEKCSMNIRSKLRYRVIFCAVQGLGGMNMVYWVK